MNAVTNSADNFIEDNAGDGSDSDTNPDGAPEYYQPISAEPDEEELEFSNQENSYSDDDVNYHQFNFRHTLPNGYANCVENGVLSLNLSDEDDSENDDDDYEAGEEDERMREETDVAIQIAFREDEIRRNAPLTPENATSVMEAMRGVSLSGFAPDWATRIPEDQWIDQLRRRPPLSRSR